MEVITGKLSIIKSLLIYVILLLTTFLVPNKVIEYSYIPFFLVLIFYVGTWYLVLKGLNRHMRNDYRFHNIDFLIYDVYYIIGLPIVMYLLAYNVDVELWQFDVLQTIHLWFMGIFIALRLILYRTKHVVMVRVAVVYMLPLANFIILNQLFTAWYISNFMSFGYN